MISLLTPEPILTILRLGTKVEESALLGSTAKVRLKMPPNSYIKLIGQSVQTLDIVLNFSKSRMLGTRELAQRFRIKFWDSNPRRTPIKKNRLSRIQC